jgi:glycosyltransferase involved in cell wall biosynthesis
MKVWALPPREDWICDRFVDEWNRWSTIACREPHTADVIWLLSDWAWRRVPRAVLETKKVVTTVHHLVPEKMGPAELADFKERDELTHAYHVPCEATRLQVEALTRRPIHVLPFWVNAGLWQPAGPELSRRGLRRALGLPEDGFLVGSFQRDTEGRDLTSPKLEKGPDLLCDALSVMSLREPGLHVVLAGWRRQYVMRRLESCDIPFTFFERPPVPKLRYLYLALDLYTVTARYEGGPQAIVECAAMNVPIVSTPVGLAPSILASCSVGPDVTVLKSDVFSARSAVTPLLVNDGRTDHVRSFERLFSQVL